MVKVIPFPNAARPHRVALVARRMAMLPADAAEDLILREAEVEYCRLIEVGVDPALVEADVVAFASAIRARLWHEVFARPGGAA